ncbi:hypothetical protein NM680_09795 [Paracoccus sp. PS-1]|uniref:hypothetical protein n=1 Tax=unclassified Paracoccus (in: a-proteobacteria) TaxID=2688777 RepID=UPI0004B0A4B4|nr:MULTISPECIES: hypothetical protein [unclassified Paracoccus (in: a-proteobacteria)]MDQ7262087.1 hypothetical protein [Paracoccus sp. PS1]
MRPPPNPYLVLASAVLLPGSGQVWNGEPQRGLIFLFFLLLLGGFTLMTTGPEISFVGRFAGAFFVHAMAIFDAYKRARIRQAVWTHDARSSARPRHSGGQNAS